LPSTTIVNEQFAIRPCFINPRTTQEMVEGFVDAVIRIGDEETRRLVDEPTWQRAVSSNVP
jgi:hypothetical protein